MKLLPFFLLWLAMIGQGCATARATRASTPATSAFHGVISGLCPKLDVARVGDRTFLVYGETGYQLGDWHPGDALVAAQSFAEVRRSSVLRNLTLLRGLPSNAGGWVPGDLSMGGATMEEAWLLRTTSRYAPRGRGALFTRELDPYVWDGRAWVRHASGDFVGLPLPARSLPDLPEEELCKRHDPALRFVRVTSAVLRSTGHVWVAGRCQNDSHVNYRPTRIMVAHGAPGAKQWVVRDVPASAQLDAIVNLGLYARTPDDVYLIAYEPFVALDRRVPFLAHFDGVDWGIEHPPMTTGLTSVSGSEDGTLWVGAGRGFWRRDVAGRWEEVILPPPPFVERFREGAMRVTGVRAFAPDDVWVAVGFAARVARERGEKVEVRGGALYHNRPWDAPLYCDAREPIEDALVAVQGDR